MSLKDQLKEDIKDCFLNSDEFAEEISYTSYGGSPKTIKAIVDRQRINPAGEDTGRILTNEVEIAIANDETEGVASINKGKDTVVFPERIGGDDVTWFVADILKQDEGMWHLLLQK